MHISNECFQSTEEGNAIYSKDGTELVCILWSLTSFNIPPGVKVTQKHFLFDTSLKEIVVPASVEVVEKISTNIKHVMFEKGSILKSIDINTFSELQF